MQLQQTKTDDPLSMVLLLRAPHFFGAAELRLAAERAWHTSFCSEDKESRHFVVQQGTVTMMKAGRHLINFFHYPSPYTANYKTNVDWLPQAVQREAWLQHSAWVGVDYMNDEVSVEVAYSVLAELVSEMLDANCTGVYIPQEQSLIPHDESLYQELKRIGADRETGITPKH